MLVEFRIGSDEAPAPADVFDLGAKARAAGYRIEMAELAEKSGFSLMDELPDLLPGDREMAAVLEAQMAEAFADAALEGSGDAPSPSPVENAEGGDGARLTVEEARALYDSMMEDDSDAR